MITTKQGALAKWCPFTRQVWAKFDTAGAFTTFGDTSAFNMVRESHGEQERRIRCVADECMMWRELGHIGMPASADIEAQRIELGYCGLGGDPLPSDQASKAVDRLQKQAAAPDKVRRQ